MPSMTESDSEAESIDRIEAALLKISTAKPTRRPAPDNAGLAVALDRLIDRLRTELDESPPE